MTDFEQSMVALGISAATAFSLPKSVGAMYGLAFASPEPLAMDDFIERLEISKGSASQGIKFLTRMGALKAVYFGRGTRDKGPSKADLDPSSVPPGPSSLRKTYYEPETSLRRLLIGILNENVLPHLQQSGDKMAEIKAQLDRNGFSKEEQKILEKRLEAIEGWGKKTRTLWPIAEKVLSGPLGKG